MHRSFLCWLATVGCFIKYLVLGEIFACFAFLLFATIFGLTWGVALTCGAQVLVLLVAGRTSYRVWLQLERGQALEQQCINYYIGSLVLVLVLDVIWMALLPANRFQMVQALMVTLSLLLPYILWRQRNTVSSHP